MIDCGMLEQIDDNCTVRFEAYKNPAPFITARELVYLDIIHRLNDGTIISFTKSIEHPARPKSKQFVRAILHIAGWAFKPVPGEPDRTKVIYLVRIDLGGSLPTYLLNQIASDIPMTVERLNLYLRKCDVSQWDLPLYHVLQYGPKKEEKEEEEEKYMINTIINSNAIISNINSNSNSTMGNERFPKMNEIQKRRYNNIINHGSFYESKAYLDIIPKNRSWIYNTLHLENASVEEHELLLDNFIIPDLEHNKYGMEIQSAFKLFNIWRKWKNGIEWEFKVQKEDMQIFTHAVLYFSSLTYTFIHTLHV